MSNQGIRVRRCDFDVVDCKTVSRETKRVFKTVKQAMKRTGDRLNLDKMCHLILGCSSDFVKSVHLYRVAKKITYLLTLGISPKKVGEQVVEERTSLLVRMLGVLTSGPDELTLFLHNEGWNLIKSALEHIPSRSGDNAQFLWNLLCRLVDHSEKFAQSLTLQEMSLQLLKKYRARFVVEIFWQRIIPKMSALPSAEEVKDSEQVLPVCLRENDVSLDQ